MFLLTNLLVTWLLIEVNLKASIVIIFRSFKRNDIMSGEETRENESNRGAWSQAMKDWTFHTLNIGKENFHFEFFPVTCSSAVSQSAIVRTTPTVQISERNNFGSPAIGNLPNSTKVIMARLLGSAIPSVCSLSAAPSSYKILSSLTLIMVLMIISADSSSEYQSFYHQQQPALSGPQISQILNEKLRDYDKRVRPNQGGE